MKTAYAASSPPYVDAGESYEEDDDYYMVMNFALLCDGGLDLQSEEACALAAESLQLEREAYMLRNQGRGKGHSGFQSQKHYEVSGSISFQERKLAWLS